jgi:hypothetical protein
VFRKVVQFRRSIVSTLWHVPLLTSLFV